MKHEAKIYVSQEAAMRRGSAEWGSQRIDLEAVLDLLLESERARVEVSGDQSTLKIRGESCILVADSTEPAAAVIAIRRRLSKQADERAEKAERARGELDRMLADPTTTLSASGTWAYGWDGDSCSRRLDTADLGDEMRTQVEAAREVAAELGRQRKIADLGDQIDMSPFAARLADDLVELGGPDRREEVATAIAEDARARAAREAAAAEKRLLDEARAAGSREAWVDWAREHGSEDLRISLRDGYPVGQQVEKEIVDLLMPAAPDGTDSGGEWDDRGERRVPRAAARDLRAALVEAVAVAHTVPMVTVAVGRIMSVSRYGLCPNSTDTGGGAYCTCGDCDSDCEVVVHRTGVQVTVSSAHYTEARWYVIVE